MVARTRFLEFKPHFSPCYCPVCPPVSAACFMHALNQADAQLCQRQNRGVETPPVSLANNHVPHLQVLDIEMDNDG